MAEKKIQPTDEQKVQTPFYNLSKNLRDHNF